MSNAAKQAVAVPVDKITSAGPGEWWFVHHPNGFLFEIGDRLHAERVAREINAGRASRPDAEREGEDLTDEDRIAYWKGAYERMAARNAELSAQASSVAAGPVSRTVSQETFERVREALAELIECAELRGDNVLPNPCDDPKTWTSRMQNAWNDAESALNETAELASDGASQPQTGEAL